jgi:hypothetical protein
VAIAIGIGCWLAQIMVMLVPDVHLARLLNTTAISLKEMYQWNPSLTAIRLKILLKIIQ